MRDQIRGLAEVEGSTTMTGLINTAIQEVLDSLTALAKYDECFVPDNVLAIAANGIVTVPTTAQHVDDDNVYFLIEGSTDLGDKYRLHRFARMRNRSTGRASQFRFTGNIALSTAQLRIQITPYGDIDTTLDKVMLNYWRKFDWTNDVNQFPFPKLEEVTMLKVAARICRGTNSRLAAKLAAQARDAYTAVRASSQIR